MLRASNRRRDDPERERVMVRRQVDGRTLRSIETRPRRRSRGVSLFFPTLMVVSNSNIFRRLIEEMA